MNDFAKNPAGFDNDILSPKMIDTYYQKYFTSRDGEMGYPITKEMISKKQMDLPLGRSIFELLSVNEKSIQAYNTDQHLQTRQSPYYLCQAFSTAGKLFEVIDQNTTTVIVPYDEGKAIIRELGNKASYTVKLRLLKKAQQYSVNLYGDLEQLLTKGDISPIGDTGSYTLNTSSISYVEDYGVISSSDAELIF